MGHAVAFLYATLYQIMQNIVHSVSAGWAGNCRLMRCGELSHFFVTGGPHQLGWREPSLPLSEQFLDHCIPIAITYPISNNLYT